MTNATKAALEASLKKLLLKKPLDKITINDLTTDCGISRMAFYYHFKDIYDLVEWSCLEDATQALQGKKTYETWQEGLQQIFEAVLENKPFIMNVYHSVSREQIETYLFHLTHDLLYGVVQEKAKGTGISEADQSFIADFYKYSFTGVMLDWIKDGMKVDYHMIAEKMHRTMEGNVVNSIRNFEKRNSSNSAMQIKAAIANGNTKVLCRIKIRIARMPPTTPEIIRTFIVKFLQIVCLAVHSLPKPYSIRSG